MFIYLVENSTRNVPNTALLLFRIFLPGFGLKKRCTAYFVRLAKFHLK